MTFDVALQLLRAGRRLARKGWMAGMSLVLVPRTDGTTTDMHILQIGRTRTTSWLPTQAEILASDWEIAR